MAKLKKKQNKSLVIIIPVIILAIFAMLLTHSYANFKSTKFYNLVAAAFRDDSYILSYNVSNCSSKRIYNDQTYGELCNPATPDDYVFAGWYLDGNLITSGTIVNVNSNVTLIANFIPDCTAILNKQYNFYYNGTNGSDGDIQEFTTLCPGEYQLETWGAQGGAADVDGGKGGYSSGTIILDVNHTLFIGVGGAGSRAGNNAAADGGYNGGGERYASSNACGSGGGATHIALDNNLGELKNYNNNRGDILIVAGGGGGSQTSYVGGVGGGLSGGKNSAGSGSGGSQTGGYGFGLGEPLRGGGGGGGWYGGTSLGGGSGYIDGVTDGQTIAGNAIMPTHDGSSIMVGNSGNGHARITYLGMRTAATRPTFTAKNVQSEYVYLTFNNSNADYDGIGCFYGVDEVEINNLGVINNNICRVPSSAAYAKVCVVIDGVPLCSVNKKLAEYIIRDGITTYSASGSNANVTVNYANDHLNFTIAAGGGGRMGMRITNIDVTPYNSVFIDMAYNVTQGTTLEFYGLSAQSYFDSTLNNNDNVIYSGRPHAANDENYNVSRTVFPTAFYRDTSNASTYSNTTFEIGRNASSSSTYDVNIYNMWFQLRD